MNYDPPHLLPFAAPVPSSTYPGLTPPYASPSISSFPFLSPFLFLSPLSLYLSIYLPIFVRLVLSYTCTTVLLYLGALSLRAGVLPTTFEGTEDYPKDFGVVAGSPGTLSPVRRGLCEW